MTAPPDAERRVAPARAARAGARAPKVVGTALTPARAAAFGGDRRAQRGEWGHKQPEPQQAAEELHRELRLGSQSRVATGSVWRLLQPAACHALGSPVFSCVSVSFADRDLIVPRSTESFRSRFAAAPRCGAGDLTRPGNAVCGCYWVRMTSSRPGARLRRQRRRSDADPREPAPDAARVPSGARGLGPARGTGEAPWRTGSFD